MKTFLIFLFIAILFGFTGCDESPLDESSSNQQVTNQYQDASKGKVKLHSTPTFDIDNATMIYYPEEDNNYLYLPWNHSNHYIPSEWLNDHYTEDGWRLIYNTFEKPGNAYPFFAIYNIYRGVIRFYFYISNDVEINNINSMFFILKTGEEDETNLLNYEFSFAEAMENKYSTPLIQKTPNFNLQVAQNHYCQEGNWYAAEFELSYDPDIEDINSDFQLTIRGAEISNVSLNDQQYGSITGDITYSSKSGNSYIGNLALGNFSTTTTNTLADIIVNDMNDAEKDNPEFFNQLLNKLQQAAGNTVTSSVENIIESIISEEVNWTENPVSNFFNNSVIGNTQQNETKVNLALKTKVSPTGNLDNLITHEDFNIPTTNYNYGMGQYIPAYDKKLGVWSIDNTPEANYRVNVFHYGIGFDDMECNHNYSFDPNSFNIVLNPEIEDEFTIKDVTKKLIMVNPPYEPYNPEPFSVATSGTNNSKVIHYEYDVGTHYGFSDQASMLPLPMALMSYIRVSFTLESISTGKEFYYAKSYKPDVEVEQQTEYYYTNPGGPGGFGF